MRKKIMLIGTGGTIACKETEDGLMPVLSSAELLQYVPEAAGLCEIETVQVFNIDSTNITPEHWKKLAAVISEKYWDYDGFLICHGTDTMAYTAAALSYMVQNAAKPITITGAQKPISSPGSDAIRNLLDSLRFTADERAGGVNVVFSGKVIRGTRAHKVQSKSFDAFQSINYPCPAIIPDGKLRVYIGFQPQGELRFYSKLNEKVGVIKLIPGMSPETLDLLLQIYDAAVLETYGVGGIPEIYRAVVEKWKEQGRIIVVATQVMNEGSDMSVYEVGKKVKRDLDLMETYDMTIEATIAKLMWILGQTREEEEVRRMFYRPVNHDIGE